MKISVRSIVLNVLGVASVLLVFGAPSIAAPRSQAASSAQHRPSSPASPMEANNGEVKFKQNCSRCHEAPQGFSPRIAGTILRHMRVRASLSKQDEREILRFLNP